MSSGGAAELADALDGCDPIAGLGYRRVRREGGEVSRAREHRAGRGAS